MQFFSVPIKKVISGSSIILLFSCIAYSLSVVFTPTRYTVQSFLLCILLGLIFFAFNYWWDKHQISNNSDTPPTYTTLIRHLCISLLIYTIVTSGFFYLLNGQNVFINPFFYLTGIPLCLIFSFTTHASLYAYRMQRFLRNVVSRPAPAAESYVVRLGNNNVQVLLRDVKYIRSAEKITRLHTWENKDYIIDHPITEMEKLCGTDLFFRANRQFLISRRAVSRFRSIENNKILLTLSDGEQLQISRYRAPEFRAWIKGRPSGPELPTSQPELAPN